MVSTVTTSTINIVSDLALATTISILVCLTLLLLLIQKEIISVSNSRRARVLGRVLNIAIVPLFIVFVLLLVFKVAQVVG